MGDLSRIETVRSLEDFWLKEVDAVVGRIPTVLVGNKLDLADESSMSATVLDTMGQKLGYPSFLASAKTGDNVEAAFSSLGELLVAEVLAAAFKTKEKPPETLSGVVDYIIQDFCAQYGDLEKAMLIVQHQFDEAAVDIRKPTKDAVLRALESLAKAEALSLSKTVAMVNLDERRKMVVLAKS